MFTKSGYCVHRSTMCLDVFDCCRGIIYCVDNIITIHIIHQIDLHNLVHNSLSLTASYLIGYMYFLPGVGEILLRRRQVCMPHGFGPDETQCVHIIQLHFVTTMNQQGYFVMCTARKQFKFGDFHIHVFSKIVRLNVK